MSERFRGNETGKLSEKLGRNLSKKAAAALLAIGLVTGAGATKAVEKVTAGDEYAVNHEVSAPSVSEAAELITANALASKHYLPVAKDVTAVVGYEDGSHINIENPIIQKVKTTDNYADGDMNNYSVVVLERTRGSDDRGFSVVTAYAVGEQDVARINFHGAGLHPDGEESIVNVNITPTPIEISPGVNGGASNHFNVWYDSVNNPTGQHLDMQVAEGTLYINQYAEK